jgi:MFS superfamily sulfate permease-like transporter
VKTWVVRSVLGMGVLALLLLFWWWEASSPSHALTVVVGVLLFIGLAAAVTAEQWLLGTSQGRIPYDE